MVIKLVVLLLLSSTSPVFAQDTPDIPSETAQTNEETNDPAPVIIKADFANLKKTGYDTVTKVIDAQTILMKSGKIIELAAINIPQIPYEDMSEYHLKAKHYLEALLPPSTKVTLHQTRNPKIGRVNRMEHDLAHVEIANDDAQWIQGLLIHEGLARAEPSPSNPELAAQMYAIEDQARTANKGLWSDESFRVLTHDNAAQTIGSFAIIEGNVAKTASVKNNVYLNFGDNWRDDFTIMISPAIRKELVRDGIDPLALNDKAVRVRGWVRDYNGPLIELNHPASLEIIKTSD